jgi:hypothetical protein
MSEWWTYRPSDFLMFSARTYYRLFELYNAEVWPAQVLTLGLGLALWLALWQGRAWAPRAAFALLGLAWLWIAWGFHWQRFASINSAAPWYAGAFAVQGVLLLAWVALDGPGQAASRRGRMRAVGWVLLAIAVAVQPALGALLGRPWQQAEVVALAPDPTVLATIGVLLQLPLRSARTGLMWPIPLLWCAISGMTLAALGATTG